MLRVFTCIICPNGCEITAGVEDNQIISIEGALCPKGETYVNQELTDPRRNIATSVLVKGGELPLASVRLTNPIPKARIFDAMAEIRGIAVEAPVEAGTVVIRGILGLDSDVIVTKGVGRRQLPES